MFSDYAPRNRRYLMHYNPTGSPQKTSCRHDRQMADAIPPRMRRGLIWSRHTNTPSEPFRTMFERGEERCKSKSSVIIHDYQACSASIRRTLLQNTENNQLPQSAIQPAPRCSVQDLKNEGRYVVYRTTVRTGVAQDGALFRGLSSTEKGSGQRTEGPYNERKWI